MVHLFLFVFINGLLPCRFCALVLRSASRSVSALINPAIKARVLFCCNTLFGRMFFSVSNNSVNSTEVASNVTIVEEQTESWVVLRNGDSMAYLTFFFAIPGMLLNFFVFFVMNVSRNNLHAAVVVLFKSQLLFDGIASFLLVFNQFSIAEPDSDAAFALRCVFYVISPLLWFFYCMSGYNIVITAAQRFVMTVYPFTMVTVKASYLALFVAFLNAVLTCAVNYGLELEINVPEKVCHLRLNNPALGVQWLIQYYLIPVILIVGFYSKVILTFRSKGGIKSSLSKKSEELMVKNAIAIALIFIICCGVNPFVYAFTNYAVISIEEYNIYYRFPTYFFTMFNSGSTPLIYMVFMKPVRVSCYGMVLKLFGMKPTAKVESSTVGTSNA